MILPLVAQPLSWIYGCMHRIRNLLYDKAILSTRKFDVPIISVGNLTLGGTGKTPIVGQLIEKAMAAGKKVGLVSRGYKGNFLGVHRVDPENKSYFFGDEPTMLAMRYPEVPVYVCPDRIKAVESLLENHKVDLIFADDAFQHRRLGRVLDIVVFDLTQSLASYKTLPAGRLREPLSALIRADILIFNKANLSHSKGFEDLQKFIDEKVKLKIPILKGIYSVKRIYAVGEPSKNLDLTKKNVLLVSGVARPETVESLCQQAGLGIVHHLVFNDHHNYTIADISKILQIAKKYSADYILVTEKDVVKLKEYKDILSVLSVIELGIEIENGETELYEKIIGFAP